MALGHAGQLQPVTFMKGAKSHKDRENVTMRIQMRTAEDGVTPRMWLTHQRPLASGPLLGRCQSTFFR